MAKLDPKAKAALRDHIALQTSLICMGDLSRQLSGGAMPIDAAPRAVATIARLSYAMADALIEERDRK